MCQARNPTMTLIVGSINMPIPLTGKQRYQKVPILSHVDGNSNLYGVGCEPRQAAPALLQEGLWTG